MVGQGEGVGKGGADRVDGKDAGVKLLGVAAVTVAAPSEVEHVDNDVLSPRRQSAQRHFGAPLDLLAKQSSKHNDMAAQ